MVFINMWSIPIGGTLLLNKDITTFLLKNSIEDRGSINQPLAIN